MGQEREPFEGGSYDEPEVEDLGAELLDDYGTGSDEFPFVGDVGRDPFGQAQLND